MGSCLSGLLIGHLGRIGRLDLRGLYGLCGLCGLRRDRGLGHLGEVRGDGFRAVGRGFGRDRGIGVLLADLRLDRPWLCSLGTYGLRIYGPRIGGLRFYGQRFCGLRFCVLRLCGLRSVGRRYGGLRG